MKSSTQTRAGLDASVVEIELTLTSIIQGVALTFLAENAHHALTRADLGSWLYVVAGLLIILIFWSRSVLHTLTLIRWPIEFVHNFIYIACTLGEVILFTHLSSPRAWFSLSVIYGVVVWVLFVVDLQLIGRRTREARGEGAQTLCLLVRRDQLLNIFALIPALLALNVVCAVLLWVRPDIFLLNGAHVWLISVALLALLVYLVYVVRLYGKLAPLVVAMREEWYQEPA